MTVWNMWDSECIMEAEGHQDTITSVAVHGDEDARTIFSASTPRSRVDEHRPSVRRCCEGHGTRAAASAVSRDGSADGEHKQGWYSRLGPRDGRMHQVYQRTTTHGVADEVHAVVARPSRRVALGSSASAYSRLDIAARRVGLASSK